MNNGNKNKPDLVSESYIQYHSIVTRYIAYRINDKNDAQDLSQDVFVRLIECREMLRCETMKSFVFTIAKNLIIDYLRRKQKRHDFTSYIFETTSEISFHTEQSIIASDIEHHERLKLSTLSAQRRKVYYLSRFEEKSVDEIKDSLNISKRTVENHLRISRHEVRTYIQACI